MTAGHYTRSLSLQHLLMGCRCRRSSCNVPPPPAHYKLSRNGSDTLTRSASRHGHYVLVICIFGMVLVVAFGRNTLADHAHFIPVYVMGSSFLISAWPSLEDSWTRLREDHRHYLLVPDTPEPQAMVQIPMAGVQYDPQGQPPSRASLSDWLIDQGRQRSSPVPVSPPPSLEEPASLPGQWPVAPWPHELQYMGPGSDRSQVRTHTGTSISLSSRQTVPSEISANAFELLCPGGPARNLRITQRRLDMEGLVPAPQEEESLPTSSFLAGRSHTVCTLSA